MRLAKFVKPDVRREYVTHEIQAQFRARRHESDPVVIRTLLQGS
jgi:hypothetical protein